MIIMVRDNKHQMRLRELVLLPCENVCQSILLLLWLSTQYYCIIIVVTSQKKVLLSMVRYLLLCAGLAGSGHI